MLLFDVQTAPKETKDLAGKPQYRKKVETLFKDLLELQKTMNDTLDLEPTYKKVIGVL